jgi:iron complex transport system substrate-binding protein
VFGSKRKYVWVLISLMVMSIWLAACGSNEKSNNANNSGAAETATNAPSPTAEQAEQTEKTMTDGLGNEVTIPANPERIIGSYLEDYLVALGVKPVAQWTVKNGVQVYLQDSLKDIPTIPFDLPYEAVTSFNPDLHLIGTASQVEGGKYEEYAKISPTYVIGDETMADWRKALLKIGEVLNKSDEAQKVLEDYDKKAAEAKAKLQASVPGESVAALWLIQKSFFVVSDKLSSGAVLYQDLGLEVPEVVKEISAASEFSWNSISLEKLAELDADHLILINSDADTGSEALKDPIWQSIPAVKNGNVHEFSRETSWLYYGPIASSQIIDNVLASLVK